MTLQNQNTSSDIILFIWKKNRPECTLIHLELFIFFRKITPTAILHFNLPAKLRFNGIIIAYLITKSIYQEYTLWTGILFSTAGGQGENTELNQFLQKYKAGKARRMNEWNLTDSVLPQPGCTIPLRRSRWPLWKHILCAFNSKAFFVLEKCKNGLYICVRGWDQSVDYYCLSSPPTKRKTVFVPPSLSEISNSIMACPWFVSGFCFFYRNLNCI